MAPPSANLRDSATGAEWSLLLAILVGAFVRAVPVLSSDFPVNDGGLFAGIIDQLAANEMRPPAHLSYNRTEIPFAYPPAALYLGAALVELGIPTLDVLRALPPFLALLIIPAWFLLAKDLFGSRIALVATVLYALIPRSYEWLIAGGGLTRSLGLLLVVLGLRFVVAYLRQRAWPSAAIAGSLLGLAALSHPEAGVFGAATACLIAWLDRGGWRRPAIIATVALATITPWIAYVVTTHGVGPLLAAGASRFGTYPLAFLELMSLQFTHEAYVALGALLGAVGVFVAMTSQRRWLLVWILLPFLFTPAAAPTFAMLPWSIAAAIAVSDIILPRVSPTARRFAVPASLSVMVLASVWSVHLTRTSLWSVPADIRQAMAWLSENVADDSEIAVVTGTHWASDAVSEWFPYLTSRRSVGTVQGTEFLPRWAAGLAEAQALQYCAGRTQNCVRSTVERLWPDVTIIFLPKGLLPWHQSSDCCVALREEMRGTLDVLYDGEGASIFSLRP